MRVSHRDWIETQRTKQTPKPKTPGDLRAIKARITKRRSDKGYK